MKRTLILSVLACALFLVAPLGALAAEETTTTVEIEISATSIAPEGSTDASHEPVDDTLPFTGASNGDLSLVAVGGLILGGGLVLLTGRTTRGRSSAE